MASKLRETLKGWFGRMRPAYPRECCPMCGEIMGFVGIHDKHPDDWVPTQAKCESLGGFWHGHLIVDLPPGHLDAYRNL